MQKISLNKKKAYRDKKAVSKEDIFGKSLPFSLEAERAVLGGLLLNDKKIDEVLEALLPGDFYVPANQVIFQTMITIARNRQRVDLITLQDELNKAGDLESCGGVSYLLMLQEDIPTVGLMNQHARIIKEKAILRELIESASSIISSCYAQDDSEIESVVDEAEKTILNISSKRSSQSFRHLEDCLKDTFQFLSDIKSCSKGITGVPSGFAKLDDLTSGFQKGDFVVLAARPSMGKTALALNLANYAAKGKLTVGFFSLEMSAEQLLLRLLSSESAIFLSKVRNANINSDEWIELTSVAAKLSEYKFFIDDTPSQSIMDIRAKARRLKYDHDLQFLVIDYLQLINSDRRFENRHQEVSEISRSLKSLAKELKIPILALSQLSRAVDARMEKRPMLSDLRESGAIEQDADLIMFLYREVLYNPDVENPDLAELILGKQRNGPTGTVFMNYLRRLTLFQEASYYDENPAAGSF